MTTPTRLTWQDIRARAVAFAREWADAGSERAEAQTFWNEFLAVFGVHRRRAGVLFERAAARFGRPGAGRIDVFWPGLLLCEHKSAGADLDAAFEQATDYFAGIADHELPRYVVVSDFARLRLYDRDTGRQDTFPLAALARHIERFGFIAGYTDVKVRDEDPLNIRAVELLGALHDALRVFPHVNGRLFEERLDTAQFTAATRALLLECCHFQWAAISPAIFGAMFQKVIELDARERRRQLGAHYTSEANIRKVIGPLFLDELRAEIPEQAQRPRLPALLHGMIRAAKWPLTATRPSPSAWAIVHRPRR